MERTPGTLRVATWNLYLGADLSLLFDVGDPDLLQARVRVLREQLAGTDTAERAVALAGILAREAPDLVALQEAARWTMAAPGGAAGVLVDFLGALTAALDAAGTPYDVVGVVPAFGGGMDLPDGARIGLTGDNVCLVRRGGRATVRAERSGRFSVEHSIDTGTGLAFPVGRSWGLVEADVDGRPVTFAHTHTEAWHAGVRDAQRDELLDLLDELDPPVVLVGDLNATPREVGVPAPYVDAWTAAGGDPAAGWTCGQDGDLCNEESLLRERIDYVFVRGAAVRACTVVGDAVDDRTPSGLWPSDHAGVVADLEL
ncbi:MAG: endonuclease/exonuclease/phosphatase family protein [Nocardioides sp.]